MSRYDLAGRTVVLTGATGGLGDALATALRERGANLALLDLDGDRARAQAVALGSDAVARGWAVDVRDLDSVQAAVDAAAAHSPLNGPYVASKAGVWALADATRLEVRHHGVAVGSAHPTFFKTPMMDDVHADAAGQKLWGGNEKGLWKMIGPEEVVGAIVAGIEHRSALIVAPESNALVARVPGLIRPFVDRFGFRGNTIPEAITLANETGWISGHTARRTPADAG